MIKWIVSIRKNGPLPSQPLNFSCKKWLVCYNVIELFAILGWGPSWNLGSDAEEFAFKSAANRVINDEKVKKYGAKIALIMKFY